MKECRKCHKKQALDKFAISKQNVDGFSNTCKTCKNAYDNKRKLKKKIIVSFMTCAVCKHNKPIEKFGKNSFTITGFNSRCKICANAEVKNRSIIRLKWINDIKKDTPCLDCGETYEPYCMDYDHVRGAKIKSISEMIARNAPKSSVLSEIKKCELVCLLCHNKRTHFRRDARKIIPAVERSIKIIDEAKAKPCYKCNIQRESYNMQFDHINPADKYSDVCRLKGRKVKTIMDEIAKCKPICALCHRIKTHFEEKPKNKAKILIRRKPFIDMDNKIKECYSCNEVLEFDKFSENLNNTSNLQGYCKKCVNKKARYRTNRKRIKNNGSCIDLDLLNKLAI